MYLNLEFLRWCRVIWVKVHFKMIDKDAKNVTCRSLKHELKGFLIFLQNITLLTLFFFVQKYQKRHTTPKSLKENYPQFLTIYNYSICVRPNRTISSVYVFCFYNVKLIFKLRHLYEVRKNSSYIFLNKTHHLNQTSLVLLTNFELA